MKNTKRLHGTQFNFCHKVGGGRQGGGGGGQHRGGGGAGGLVAHLQRIMD